MRFHSGVKNLVIFAALLSLVACAYQTEMVTADSEHIAIKAGKYANPGAEASAHCAQYGKRAEFDGGSNKIYRFRCVQ